jgi:hypothetical protein
MWSTQALLELRGVGFGRLPHLGQDGLPSLRAGSVDRREILPLSLQFSWLNGAAWWVGKGNAESKARWAHTTT